MRPRSESTSSYSSNASDPEHLPLPPYPSPTFFPNWSPIAYLSPTTPINDVFHDGWRSGSHVPFHKCSSFSRLIEDSKTNMSASTRTFLENHQLLDQVPRKFGITLDTGFDLLKHELEPTLMDENGADDSVDVGDGGLEVALLESHFEGGNTVSEARDIVQDQYQTALPRRAGQLYSLRKLNVPNRFRHCRCRNLCHQCRSSKCAESRKGHTKTLRKTRRLQKLAHRAQVLAQQSESTIALEVSKPQNFIVSTPVVRARDTAAPHRNIPIIADPVHVRDCDERNIRITIPASVSSDNAVSHLLAPVVQSSTSPFTRAEVRILGHLEEDNLDLMPRWMANTAQTATLQGQDVPAKHDESDDVNISNEVGAVIDSEFPPTRERRDAVQLDPGTLEPLTAGPDNELGHDTASSEGNVTPAVSPADAQIIDDNASIEPANQEQILTNRLVTSIEQINKESDAIDVVFDKIILANIDILRLMDLKKQYKKEYNERLKKIEQIQETQRLDAFKQQVFGAISKSEIFSLVVKGLLSEDGVEFLLLEAVWSSVAKKLRRRWRQVLFQAMHGLMFACVVCGLVLIWWA